MSSNPLHGSDALTDVAHEAALRVAVGTRIRDERQRLGFSGRKLAQLARVTPAFISQVERGQVIPSVSTLLRITNVLGVKIGDLFDADEPSAGDLLTRGEWPIFDFPDSRSEHAVLASDPQQRLEVFWKRMAPEATTGDELIAHDAEIQWVFVLRGRLELRLGEQRHLLREHASITFPGSVPHGYRNPGARPVEFLTIVTPSVYAYTGAAALAQTGASTRRS
jgi:transcriptional regulator with XRE-family HTH domain